MTAGRKLHQRIGADAERLDGVCQVVHGPD